MEQIFAWLLQEIIAHWVILVLGAVSAAALKVLKRYWPSVVTDALSYAIVGGVVAFICILLLIQTRLQIETSVKSANGSPARPYFTQAQAEIQTVSPGTQTLTVSIQNNDVPVKDVVSQLLVLEESLDPTRKPLHTKRLEPANDIGPRGIFSHHLFARIKQNMRPVFVVFQIRYTDALSNETYSQALFLKFFGVSQDGTFIQELFSASSDEKNRMERYMREHGIPTL